MPFYKLENEDLIESDFLEGPGFCLSEASKNEYTYPVENWYWFADLEAAQQLKGFVYDKNSEEYQAMMKEVRGRA